jgi:hypothetical protein
MSEWISVEDRLPEDSHDNQLLLWNGVYARIGICLGSAKYKQLCFYTIHEQRLNGITHWMPLPQPPETDK